MGTDPPPPYMLLDEVQCFTIQSLYNAEVHPRLHYKEGRAMNGKFTVTAENSSVSSADNGGKYEFSSSGCSDVEGDRERRQLSDCLLHHTEAFYVRTQ